MTKKVNIELKKENTKLSSQKIKKPTTSSQAFKLFSEMKNPIQVAIELNIDFEKVRKYWTEFLQLNKMKKLYNIYVQNEYHLDYLFRIYYFLLRNEIPIKDMENLLKRANDKINLNQTISNHKAQIEKLNQIKNNYSSNQNTNHKQLLPIRPTKILL